VPDEFEPRPVALVVPLVVPTEVEPPTIELEFVPGVGVPPRLPLSVGVLVLSELRVPSPPKLPPKLNFGCSAVFTGVVVDAKSDNPVVGFALSTPVVPVVVGAVVTVVEAVDPVDNAVGVLKPPRLNVGLSVVAEDVIDFSPSVNVGFTSASLFVNPVKPVVPELANRPVDPPRLGIVDVSVVAGIAAVVVVVEAAVVPPRLKPLKPVETGAFTGVVVDAVVAAVVPPRLKPENPVEAGGLAAAVIVDAVDDVFDVRAPKLGVELELNPPKPVDFGAVVVDADVVEDPNKDVAKIIKMNQFFPQ